MLRRISTKTISKTILIETAWEVCNQVGGIYTVIRSKIPTAISKWKDHYCLLGPYVDPSILSEIDLIEKYDDPVGIVVKKMRDMGIEVVYGTWLVSGRPKVVLLNPKSVFSSLNDIKHKLWKYHSIPVAVQDDLLNQVLAFGHLVTIFFSLITDRRVNRKKVIGHFHEWMGGVAIPEIRRKKLRTSIVFTTHATLLGRYLAMNDANFYKHLAFYDWGKEAHNFNIVTQVSIERAAAHGSHVFTTVSEVTAKECEYLIGRVPDIILPNGINVERFFALHEFQNLHVEFKDRIHRFVMSHFFQSFPFDLKNTLYFFTSGRFEYMNKGFDITLEALARLNWRLKQEKINKTVVMFIITKRPCYTMIPQVLQSHAMLEELENTCEAIKDQLGKKLFFEAAASSDNKFPELNDYLDDYWKLRYRRTLQAWKSKNLPSIVTHTLVEGDTDPILNFLRTANLVNNAHDRVKIVYHPDFITASNPLFGMDYNQFIRGCNLGIFPSYYEPWGYTPLESMVSGVPAITSDLSGFGDYVIRNVKDPAEKGIYVVEREKVTFNEAAEELTEFMLSFVKQTSRQRLNQRNKVENSSIVFDWKNLIRYYERAYNIATQRMVNTTITR